MSKVNKKVVLPVVAILTVAGGGGVYYLNQRQASTQKPETSQTNSQKDGSDSSNTPDTGETPDSNIPVDNSGNPEADHTPKQFETPAGSNASQITGVINFKSVSGSTLALRNTIDQKLTSGTCKLTLTNSSTGKVLTQTADIIANPSSSTCMGFTVNNISKGSWSITIDITSGSLKGQIKDSVKV